MSDEMDYEVGFGKPPKSGQFKPGQSGNPKGRPKGRKRLDIILDDVLRKKITIREGGKAKKVSQIEALFRRIMNDGLTGDPKATDQALKLLSILQARSDDSSAQPGAGLPDLGDDLATIKEFLQLHDIPTGTLTEGIQDG